VGDVVQPNTPNPVGLSFLTNRVALDTTVPAKVMGTGSLAEFKVPVDTFVALRSVNDDPTPENEFPKLENELAPVQT
jgi:hypothetical protein